MNHLQPQQLNENTSTSTGKGINYTSRRPANGTTLTTGVPPNLRSISALVQILIIYTQHTNPFLGQLVLRLFRLETSTISSKIISYSYQLHSSSQKVPISPEEIIKECQNIAKLIYTGKLHYLQEVNRLLILTTSFFPENSHTP